MLVRRVAEGELKAEATSTISSSWRSLASHFFPSGKKGEKKREEDCIKMEEVGEIYEIISASLV